MSSVDFDTKLTDSLERQLINQAAEERLYAGPDFRAFIGKVGAVLSALREGIFAARKEAAKGEW